MRNEFDVAIVGASLAGSSLAYHLSRAGCRVALIDRQNFPRRKPCGEGLSLRGLQVLDRMGLGPALTSRLAPVKLRGYEVDFRGAVYFLPGNTFGIARVRLDDFLLRETLRNSNVTPFLGVEARQVTQHSGGFSIAVGERAIAARYLVLATGSSSRLLASPSKEKARRRFGITSAWEGSFTKVVANVRISLYDGHEVFITPTSKDRVNCSILISKESGGTGKEEALRAMRAALEDAGFAGTLISELLGSAPLQCMRRPAYRDGIFATGDACEQFDPIGGMGMTHALFSAELLGKELAPVCRGEKDPISAGTSYARSREIMARPLRAFTAAIYAAFIPYRGLIMQFPRTAAFFGPALTGAISDTRSFKTKAANYGLSAVGAYL